MSQNRIQQTSITPTIGRQTPKNDFGDELANVMKQIPSMASSVLGALPVGIPALSAAVGSMQSVAAGVTSVGGGSSTVGGQGPVGGSGGLDAGASTQDLLNQIASGGNGSQIAYLQLQQRMQEESQQFSAISNIMKVRSDSAKAAINNIR